MNSKAISSIAKNRGIKPVNLIQTSLIRTVQLEVGNFDCYGTAYTGECDQFPLSWRTDSLNQITRVKH